MDQKIGSKWVLAFDTLFLCILSLDLGFFTWLFWLNALTLGSNQSENLAAPIAALFSLVIWPVAAVIYFIILRLIKNHLSLSNQTRYVWYFFILAVPCAYIVYLYYFSPLHP